MAGITDAGMTPFHRSDAASVRLAAPACCKQAHAPLSGRSGVIEQTSGGELSAIDGGMAAARWSVTGYYSLTATI